MVVPRDNWARCTVHLCFSFVWGGPKAGGREVFFMSDFLACVVSVLHVDVHVLPVAHAVHLTVCTAKALRPTEKPRLIRFYLQ